MHSGMRPDLYRQRKATSEMNYFLCFIIFIKTESIVLRDIYFHNQYVPKLYLNHFTLYYIFSNYRMRYSST